MAVRLIALDLDGTALKHHRDFSERNAKAVSAALKAGILVVPATGRSYIDIPKELRELPGIPYFVTSNGANIVDGRTGESSFHDLIPWETAVKALHMLEDYEVQPSVHMNGASVNLKTADPRIVAKYGNSDYFTRHSADSLTDYVTEQKQGVEKIYAVLFQPEVKPELTARITSVLPLSVSASGPDNVELNSLTASKGQGLSRLCEYLGIRAEETAVIGDSINDISMFRFAGCRIAMGNAEACVKELSRYVTGDCEEDGAALAIERIVSGEWK